MECLFSFPFLLSHGDVFLPSAKSLRPLLNHNTGGLQVLLSGTCIQHTNLISDTPSAGSHDGFNSWITAAFSVRTRVSLGFNDLFLERNVTEKHAAKGKRSQWRRDWAHSIQGLSHKRVFGSLKNPSKEA